MLNYKSSDLNNLENITRTYKKKVNDLIFSDRSYIKYNNIYFVIHKMHIKQMDKRYQLFIKINYK